MLRYLNITLTFSQKKLAEITKKTRELSVGVD